MRVAISCSTMLSPAGCTTALWGRGIPSQGVARSGPDRPQGGGGLFTRGAPGPWLGKPVSFLSQSCSLSNGLAGGSEPEGRSWGGRGGSSGWASTMAKGYGGHGTFHMVEDGHNKHGSALCLMGCLTGLPNSLQSSAGCPPHRRGS